MNLDKVTRDRASPENSMLSHDLDQIRLEESRVLEAYRLAILTPEQLARELGILKGRRELLESRKIETQAPTPIPDTILKGSVNQICAVMVQRLRTLNPEGRQKLLRMLITKVIFEDNRVKIIGSLPMDRNEDRKVSAVTGELRPRHRAGGLTRALKACSEFRRNYM
jgi:hypothetical protein